MKIFTIMELCSWLDIPRKAFYRYFSSKEGALYALIDHTLMDLLDALERNELSGLLVQRAILLATDADPATGFGACRAWNGRGVDYICNEINAASKLP